MAVVNVDLSEYDAIRKRNSELEEQVKELKKLNESLKGGSKVILRKEIVVERKVDFPTYDHITGLPTREQRMCRDTTESSESYVNFEDVRLKVEQAMQDEVKRSIHDRDCERQAYASGRNKLEDKYNGMMADLKKTYEKKEKDLEEKYHRKECDFESEKLRILNLLPNVHKYAEELHDYLDKRFFVTNHAIMLAKDIVSLTTKRQ
mgnify:CR=1 FL=1